MISNVQNQGCKDMICTAFDGLSLFSMGMVVVSLVICSCCAVLVLVDVGDGAVALITSSILCYIVFQ